MTPRFRAGSGSLRMALYAPRILNAPIGCSFSSLRCAPSSSTHRSCVRRAIPRRPSAASVMSREVTTLLLPLRLGRCLVLVLIDGVIFIFPDDPRHIHDEVAGRQVHDLHALGVTAGN